VIPGLRSLRSLTLDYQYAAPTAPVECAFTQNNGKRPDKLLALTIVCAILSSMIDESLLAKVSSLSPADRLELIGVVWNTLSSDDLPVTDAERALLDARLADMEAHPDDQSPWPEVKARLERLSR
jgi:putative addiction module component (TIGR02574 family)